MSDLHAALGRFLATSPGPRALVLPAPVLPAPVVSSHRALLEALPRPWTALATPSGLRLGGGEAQLHDLPRDHTPQGFRTTFGQGAPDHRAALFFAQPFDPEDPRNRLPAQELSVTAVPWCLGPGPGLRLPRWQYHQDGAHASLTLALGPDEAPTEATLRATLGAILAAMNALASSAYDGISPIIHRVDLSTQAWKEYLLKIHDVLKQGRYSKLVAARVRALEFAAAPDPGGVFLRARALHPGAGAYLWELPGAGALVGATPETLARVGRDGWVGTHALAGTRRAQGEDPEGALRGSAKDRDEHRAVVEGLAHALGPLCEEVSVEASPGVRRVGDLLHLETPVRARLRAAVDPLEAVAALHPTPAVGGLPRGGAARWLSAHEPAPRGLYAGPLGWVELPREGERPAMEARVALRCALLRGRRAYLYAGAGVMPASRPEDEYRETEAKLQPMLRALGLGG